MKKMIFSAVALVAFSFAGMANNENGDKKEVKRVDCIALASASLDLAESFGMEFNQESSAAYFTSVLNACEIANKGR